MKNKIVLISIIIILLLLVFLVIYIFNNKDVIKIKNLKSMNFFYTSGYAFNADFRYEYENKNGKHFLSYKPYGKSEEEKTTIEVDDSILLELESILNKYDIYKWNDFNKSNNDVLDGDSFSLSIYYDNNNNISAHGYMSWPKNYREFKNDIISLFEKYFKN